MQDRVKPEGPKTESKVELTGDPDLLANARAAGVDLSALLDRALRRELGSRTSSQGLTDAEREIHEEINRYVAQHGSPLDEWRNF